MSITAAYEHSRLEKSYNTGLLVNGDGYSIYIPILLFHKGRSDFIDILLQLLVTFYFFVFFQFLWDLK